MAEEWLDEAPGLLAGRLVAVGPRGGLSAEVYFSRT
jgi:hypothetical protein